VGGMSIVWRFVERLKMAAADHAGKIKGRKK
jgi:hypothetical protein